MRVEVCSQCHPFYTGEKRMFDTAGRVQKFQERWGDQLEEQKKRLSEEE
jgi:large subunit ribosomal protein L31